MEKGKIKKVTGNGSYTNDHGTFYNWEIEMENGQVGTASTKEQNQTKWVVGQEVCYEVIVKGKYTNFKLVTDPNAGKPQNNEPAKNYVAKDASIIAAQSCLGYACTLTQQSQKYTDIDYVLGVAEKFHQWVMSKQTK